MNTQKRIKKAREHLKKSSVDALLITSVPSIIYLTGFSNFSKDEREAYLLITQTEQYIFTDARYSEAVLKGVPDFKLLEISAHTPFKELLKNLFKKAHIKTLGIEEDTITVKEEKSLHECVSMLKQADISSLREIKDTSEVNLIEAACILGDQAFEYILGQLKPGVSEKEVALKLETFMREQGAEPSFKSIVAFGSHSSVPHHETGDTKLTNNSIVLLDFGVKLNNYCSDMTRTVFFGQSEEKFQKIYETVKTAQEKAIEFLDTHHSAQASEIDQIAREYIVSQGYPPIPHSLGHGIGLEVHEAPRLSPNSHEKLSEGMVFSIEPGIYIPDFGGVRIEDLVAIQGNSLKSLTQSPKTLLQL